MENKKRMVCPMAAAGILDGKLRRRLHNPHKILKPFIRKNMTILDIGCGPGVFSIEAANLMEGTGKVISIDMQEAMLDIIKNKISGTSIENCIKLHKCSQYELGVKEKADLVLMIYMVHEVPDKNNLFNEVLPLINKNGLLMIVEPFLITAKDFKSTIDLVKSRGFEAAAKLKIHFSKGIVLKKL